HREGNYQSLRHTEGSSPKEGQLDNHNLAIARVIINVRGPMCRLHEEYHMATRWDELITEYDKISTQTGQAQFITDWTGFSDECIRRVLGHLLTQPVFFSEEWDLKAQARNAGVSFDEYAVAMIPLVRMSVERSEARLREITARIDSGDDPGFLDDA